MAYIYKITNLVNNKVYIGQTSNEFRIRKAKHLCELRSGKHGNRYIQRAFNKYGEENFSIDIIVEVHDLIKIDELEDFYIKQHSSNNIKYGYNLRVVAKSNKGIKFGPQTKKHIDKRTKSMLATRLKNNSTPKGESHMNYDKFFFLEERIKLSKNGFPGTKFDKRRQTWTSRIYINDKEKYLGSYKTQQEAFEIYKQKYYELEQEYLKSQSLIGDKN